MGYHVTTFQDADDFLARTVGLYRTNEWDSCDTHVEVWCESRSLAGVIGRTCSELGVSLYPAGGFASETFIYEAASEIEEIGKPVVLLYLGDFDPAGLLIDQDIAEKMRRHLPGLEIALHRLAITPGADRAVPASDQAAKGERETPPRHRADRGGGGAAGWDYAGTAA